MNKHKIGILLDIDSKDVRKGHVIGKRLAEVEKYLGVKPIFISVKESSKGFHVRIEAETTAMILPEALAFIQLYLGSDRFRELNNLRRILGYRAINVQPHKWNILFNGKKRHDGSLSIEKKTDLSEEFKARLEKSYNKWRVELAKSG